MSINYLLKAYPDKPIIDVNLPQGRKLNIEFLDAVSFGLKYTEDMITFSDIWQNTHLQFHIQENVLKEVIVLKNSDVQEEFKFKITTDLDVILNDNKILFVDQSQTIVYFFETPYLILANGEERHDANSIKQAFNKETGIYTLTVAKFPEDCYPIIVDPTVVFPFYEEHSPEGYTVSGQKNTNVFLVGTNALGSNLGFSNQIKVDAVGNPISPSILKGGDLVTFHKKVFANLDFLTGETQTPDLTSITIHSNKKITSIFSNRNIEYNFNASVSTVLLYVPKNNNEYGTRKTSYKYTVNIGEIVKQFQSYDVDVSLVSTPNSLPLTDRTFGEIDTPKKDGVNYIFNYFPPIEQPVGDVLIRIKINLNYKIGNETKSFSRILYSYIQFVDQMYSTSKQKFDFVSGAAKTDLINGDFYAPTRNKGLLINDASLGIVRMIDQHNGLLSPEELSVLCAGRIGQVERFHPYKGILVCTGGGVYYFKSDPYAEPSRYENKVKISKKIIIDFCMSGPNLFMLDDDGKIYRIGYKHLLNKIKGSQDISDTIDNILNSSHNQPLHPDNFTDTNDETTINYASPYDPSIDGLPQKLTPFSTIPSVGNVSRDKPTESVYVSGVRLPWHGISVVYKDNNSADPSKVVLSIAYAPIGPFKDAYGGHETLYDYLNETNNDLISSFPDRESQMNRVIQMAIVDKSPNGKYEMRNIATPDKPKMSFDYDVLKPSFEQHNEIMLNSVGPVSESSSRVVVGAVVSYNNRNKDNTSTLLKTQPKNNSVHFCPQNISIVDIEEFGPDYNPETGEEIK